MESTATEVRLQAIRMRPDRSRTRRLCITKVTPTCTASYVHYLESLFFTHEEVYSLSIDAVNVYSLSEKSSDNQLPVDFIVTKSVWSEGSFILLFCRTKNANPPEVGIQEDDSVPSCVSHENSIVRIECQIIWIIQRLRLILRNKTTDDQPSVSGQLTNDDQWLVLLAPSDPNVLAYISPVNEVLVSVAPVHRWIRTASTATERNG